MAGSRRRAAAGQRQRQEDAAAGKGASGKRSGRWAVLAARVRAAGADDRLQKPLARIVAAGEEHQQE